MRSPHEKIVRHLQQRLGALLVLRKALAYLTLWCFIWGTGVVILRVAASAPPEMLLWGLAVVPLVLAAALVMALRELPSPVLLRAVLDRAGGYGGMLMAAGERPLGEWDHTLPPGADVRLRWHAGPACLGGAASALFVAVGLLMPQRVIDLAATRALEIGKEVEKLAAQLDVLKEEKIVEPSRAEALKEKLARVQEEAQGTNPAKTLEALDHLQNLVNKEAQKAAEESASGAEQLARAEGLADALREAGDTLDPKVQSEAMAELKAMIRKAAAETAALDKHLDAALLKALRSGTLTPEQLEKLAAALKGSGKDLKGKLQKLVDAKLIDPEVLKECEGNCKCDPKALLEALKRHGGKKSIAAILQESTGRGGLDEGPGAAKLTFGKESEEEGAKFKEESLPPAAVAGMKASQVVGLSRDAPTRAGAAASKSGALNQAAAGGGSAQTQVVLPRHRETVERYFARPGAKSTPAKGE